MAISIHTPRACVLRARRSADVACACGQQGRVAVRGSGTTAAGGQLRFGIVKPPKFGQFGWNNSVSGEFIYSPRDYYVQTTNHGVQSENPIPGCKFDCDNCPNEAADGVSTLIDPDNGQIIPLATEEEVKWVKGFECPELSVAEIACVENADDDKTGALKTRYNTDGCEDTTAPECGTYDECKDKYECMDVPPRLCAATLALVPRDEFKFRAMNDFGTSNWATVTIVFDHVDSPAAFLQTCVIIGTIMMVATCGGMLRLILLQLLLVPYRRYELVGKFCAGCCAPPEEKMEAPRASGDYKPDFLKPGYEETANPILAGALAFLHHACKNRLLEALPVLTPCCAPGDDDE